MKDVCGSKVQNYSKIKAKIINIKVKLVKAKQNELKAARK